MIKDNILVVTLGYFGRGSSVKEAAENCYKAGSSRSQKASVVICSAPVKFIDILTIETDPGAFQVTFTVRTLGALLK